MRVNSLLRSILAMKQTRVVGATFAPSGLEVEVAPTTRLPRCSGCGCVRRKVYDRRSRAWRHLDFGGMAVTLRYELRRVECPRCGTVAELIPWAEHESRYTRDFEDHVAYLAQRSDQTAVSATMRIAWRTVGSIIERVVARCRQADLLDDLEYIGIDELSYRRHHEYLTVVVDHVKQRVVWASEGKNAATLARFFDALGADRTAKLKCVTVDMSAAYIEAVYAFAPTISGVTNFTPCRAEPVALTIKAGYSATFLGHDVAGAEVQIAQRSAAPFDPPVNVCRI